MSDACNPIRVQYEEEISANRPPSRLEEIEARLAAMERYLVYLTREQQGGLWYNRVIVTPFKPALEGARNGKPSTED